MGDFAAAFNNMVALLSSREDGLRKQQTALHLIFDKIDASIVVAQEDEALYKNKTARRHYEQNPLM